TAPTRCRLWVVTTTSARASISAALNEVMARGRAPAGRSRSRRRARGDAVRDRRLLSTGVGFRTGVLAIRLDRGLRGVAQPRKRRPERERSLVGALERRGASATDEDARHQ